MVLVSVIVIQIISFNVHDAFVCIQGGIRQMSHIILIRASIKTLSCKFYDPLIYRQVIFAFKLCYNVCSSIIDDMYLKRYADHLFRNAKIPCTFLLSAFCISKSLLHKRMLFKIYTPQKYTVPAKHVSTKWIILKYICNIIYPLISSLQNIPKILHF